LPGGGKIARKEGKGGQRTGRRESLKERSKEVLFGGCSSQDSEGGLLEETGRWGGGLGTPLPICSERMDGQDAWFLGKGGRKRSRPGRAYIYDERSRNQVSVRSQGSARFSVGLTELEKLKEENCRKMLGTFGI